MYSREDQKDLTEALSSVDANLWQEAFNDEIDSFESNRTWHLVDLPPGSTLNNLLIHQMDVKTAFLNADLEEEIYMEQLEDQSHYIEKILKKYNYFESKSACTPYDSSVKLFKNTNDSVNQSEYTSIISSLRYATDYTRPDIAYTIELLCYSNANWNSLLDDSKATSGYIFNITGGAVTWKSKKQTILAQSTMDSKMIALATTSEEASWLRSLL
ncbi:putative Polyprotein [Cucumis melo var. makuwa]|uniref:Polyprotein n=1 Tax=Cucumis melo var. makuwa TaxID=1194695 RepID=A0A5A7TJ57_CUCMM|nr:putative Polyprotein [Cucumis melo var. makuwa]TYJ97977.1 putative Polyprotein [Cucumis melo var. makuwa]